MICDVWQTNGNEAEYPVSAPLMQRMHVIEFTSHLLVVLLVVFKEMWVALFLLKRCHV